MFYRLLALGLATFSAFDAAAQCITANQGTVTTLSGYGRYACVIGDVAAYPGSPVHNVLTCAGNFSSIWSASSPAVAASLAALSRRLPLTGANRTLAATHVVDGFSFVELPPASVGGPVTREYSAFSNAGLMTFASLVAPYSVRNDSRNLRTLSTEGSPGLSVTHLRNPLMQSPEISIYSGDVNGTNYFFASFRDGVDELFLRINNGPLQHCYGQDLADVADTFGVSLGRLATTKYVY